MLTSVPLVVGGKYQVSTNVLVSAGLANGSPVTLVDAVFPQNTKFTKRTVSEAIIWEASQPASCIIVNLTAIAYSALFGSTLVPLRLV